MTEPTAPERKKKRKKTKKRSEATEPAASPRSASATGKRSAADGLRAQRLVALAATIAVIGLAIVGTSASDLGAALVLIGAVGLAWSLHRFGRLGPEAG